MNRFLSSVAMLAFCGILLIPQSCVNSPEIEAAKEPALVWRVDASGFKDTERLVGVCLQGLANREIGRVFLDYGTSLRWLQFDFDRDNGDRGGRVFSQEDADAMRDRYPSVDAYWIQFYESRGLARFETVTLPELLKLLAPELDGVVLFENAAEDLSAAATLAGVRNLAALSPAQYQEWVLDAGLDLPVRVDMREIRAGYPEGADRRLAAHRWMIDNVYPECARAGAVSRDRTYGNSAHDTIVDIDLAVSQRWVVFDLSFMSEESRLGGENDEPRRHPEWGFDPPDKPLLMEILDGLDDWAPVYGWGRPYESALTRRLAIHRTVKVCGGTANGSFYRYMPRIVDEFRQARHVEKVELEPKYYITFMTNEGDTLKAASNLVNGGGWLQSARGRLPINWGVNPQLIRDTPGLMSTYYATATDKDYFFSATSGWGYLTPLSLPDADLSEYAAMIRMGGEIADTRYIDVWWMNALRERNQFFPFLEAMNMRGLTQWSGRQEVEYSPSGIPVIHSNYYYPRFRPEVLAEKILRQAEEFPPPWFIVIYGGQPHYFEEVARRLPAERFKPVLLDEFFEAARLARPQVEGRVWTPSKETPMTEAP